MISDADWELGDSHTTTARMSVFELLLEVGSNADSWRNCGAETSLIKAVFSHECYTDSPKFTPLLLNAGASPSGSDIDIIFSG